MKITYVIDYLYGLNGGTENQLHLLIQGMVSRGHDVELYVLRETDFTRSNPTFPCKIYSLGIDTVLSLSGLIKLKNFRRLLVANKVDVVHGFFNDVAMILPILLIGTNITSFTSRRDMGIWYTPTKLRYLRLFGFTKTRLICNSLAVAKLAHDKERKSLPAITVIFNAMERLPIAEETELYDWVPEKREQSGIINVVLVANVRPVKRLEDLIRAAIRLNKGLVGLKYYVLGSLQDKDYCDSLQMLLKSNGLEKDFVFAGPVAEPRKILGRFDIGVLTSESEGFSNTIMEYLDAGLPVIASRVGGNPELVIHGHNGLLYTAGDVDALANCLQRLASDPGLRKDFSANAAQFVQQFDVAKMIHLHEKAYAHG